MSSRRQIPSEPIGTLADDVGRHFVALHCKKCGHSHQYDPAELADRYGVDYPMRMLARNGVCTKCGAKGCSVTISAPSTPYVEPQPRGWCRLSDRSLYVREFPALGPVPLRIPEAAPSNRYVVALRRIAAAVAGTGKGNLWMDSKSKSLRAKPTAVCLNEDSFQQCLDALESDLRIKIPKRDREPPRPTP